MKEKKRLILIGGMNRGGTSALAAVLERCGVSLDLKHIKASSPMTDPTRPDGGYERHEIPAIVLFNRDILVRSLGSMENPPTPDEITLTASDALTIASVLNDIPSFPFGLKDPHFTFLYQHWKRVASSALPDVTLDIVLPVRHPMDQANALFRRGRAVSLEGALDRWIRYAAQMVRLAKEQGAYLVIHDRDTDAYTTQVRNLCGVFEIEFRENEVRQAYQTSQSPEIDRASLKTFSIGPWAESLYQELCSLAKRQWR